METPEAARRTRREDTMDRPMPSVAFGAMALMFRLRDLVSPRDSVLAEAGIEPGSRVLDFGCGPGAYIAPLAALVGRSGKVYALDLHPRAMERVRDLARRRQLVQVETIQSDCATGLPEDSVDTVLLYDIFHMLGEPEAILTELHRVLMRDGVLSVLDPHMEEGKLISGITGSHLFQLTGKGARTYAFQPRD